MTVVDLITDLAVKHVASLIDVARIAARPGRASLVSGAFLASEAGAKEDHRRRAASQGAASARRRPAGPRRFRRDTPGGGDPAEVENPTVVDEAGD